MTGKGEAGPTRCKEKDKGELLITLPCEHFGTIIDLVEALRDSDCLSAKNTTRLIHITSLLTVVSLLLSFEVFQVLVRV